MISRQKGGLEWAHVMLQMILSEKVSFVFLTQLHFNMIVSHINSTTKEKLHCKAPYDMTLETLGEEPLKTLQFRRLSPEEVNLMPKLIALLDNSLKNLLPN